MTAQSHQKNTEGADLLRGIAILMVLVYHVVGPKIGFYVPWNGWFRDFDTPANLAPLWLYPVTLGWAGVSLFFVISGFCIHYSFMRRGDFNSTHFFLRRFFRIYPAYVVALLAFTVFRNLDVFSIKGFFQFGAHAALAHNLSGGTFFGINSSFWSIATEFQLYLLFPVMLMIRKRFGMTGCLIVVFLIGCGWRLLAASVWGLPEHLIDWAWTFPLMTWFDWCVGALVAERFYEGRRVFGRPVLLLAVLVPALVASTIFKPLTIFSFTFAALISAVLLDVSLQISWRKTGFEKAIVFVGTVSYSLYLWHQPLLFPFAEALMPITGSESLAWVMVFLLLLLIAFLSYQLLEKPGIRLGNRCWKYLSSDHSRGPRTSTARINEAMPSQAQDAAG